MNAIAHGVDLTACLRIEQIWQEHGEHFLQRVYTPAERDYCLNCKTPAQRLAGRFAAKEAVMKALGTGWRGGMKWTDIETLNDTLGRPRVTLRGETARLAAQQGFGTILISISHTPEYAIASVIALPADSA
jgi:holo-[acyl-carrier protein] synthase